MNKNYEVLVLEAGGVKGISFLGFLDTLYNENIIKSINDIKYIAGTSCGAAIGFLLSIGYTPREIFLYITTNDILDLFSNYNIFSLPTNFGFISSDSLKKYLELMTIKKIGYLPTFNDLYLKFGKFFMCPAYNMNGSSKDECQQYFSLRTHGDMYVTDAVILSCSIPIIFTKSLYKNNIYIDGGIFDSCPLEKIIETCSLKNENILCLRFRKEKNKESIDDIYSYVKKIFLSIIENTKKSITINEKIELIEIDTEISSFEFSLTKMARMNIFLKGQELAKNYYRTHRFRSSGPGPHRTISDCQGPDYHGQNNEYKLNDISNIEGRDLNTDILTNNSSSVLEDSNSSVEQTLEFKHDEEIIDKKQKKD
jgi:predicted patatin/cPLA2 family phospholipase